MPSLRVNVTSPLVGSYEIEKEEVEAGGGERYAFSWAFISSLR